MRKQKQKQSTKSPLRVGNAVLIFTVTHYFTGRIVALTKDEVVLADAAWIADTGRFSECLATGTMSEVEIVPPGRLASVQRGAGVVVFDWCGDLPKATK